MHTYETVLVNSHAADVLGYNHETQVLRVVWRDSSEGYDYQNVTLQQWEALLEAPSVGSWIARNIRFNPEAHPFTRVTPNVTFRYVREAMRQSANTRFQINSI